MRLFPGLFALGLLSACSQLPPVSSAPLPAVSSRALASSFSLSGRLSVSDGERNASGLIHWQHDRHSDQLALDSPLGQRVAQLDADAAGALLRTADGQRLHAASAEALLPQLFGIEVALPQLLAWLQALPPATAEIRRRDEQGRPLLVIDQGWRIEYARYQHEGVDALPTRLDLSREPTHLRLHIDSWTLHP